MRLRDGRNWVLLCIIALISAGCSVWVCASALESVEYPDEALEQVEFSAIWPVSKQISLMGRWHYDVQRSRTVEGFVGMQYDDCCIRVRFLLTQALRSSAYLPLSVAGSADYALRSNQGIAVEFALKGLVRSAEH